MASVLLSSTYFGPIQWYQKLYRHECCYIEKYDHFIKQTYRNRCQIATTQGVQTLSIPVEKFDAPKCLMRDVRISDHANWRHVHWNALVSAYGESPFFEFYKDDIRPFFTKKWTFLYDFNFEIMQKMCELLDIEPNVRATTEYLKIGEGHGDASEVVDFREAIHPKRPQPDCSFQPQPYYQVYAEKHGFLPNLSIIDLLMNLGNEAILLL